MARTGVRVGTLSAMTDTSTPDAELEAPVDLALRETLVFRMRAERRMSFREIADALGRGTIGPDGKPLDFKVSPSMVHADFWRVMEREGWLRAPEEIERYKAEQLQECALLKRGAASGAFSGDVKAMGAYLRVLEHEARLLGLWIRAPESMEEAEAAEARIQSGIAEVVRIFEEAEAMRRSAMNGDGE